MDPDQKFGELINTNHRPPDRFGHPAAILGDSNELRRRGDQVLHVNDARGQLLPTLEKIFCCARRQATATDEAITQIQEALAKV